jgi:hypothetical protein
MLQLRGPVAERPAAGIAAAERRRSAVCGRERRLRKIEQEDARMKTSTMTIWLAAALAAGQVSVAQRSPETPSARTPSAEAITVSDTDLETFATIYVDLLDTAAKFEAEMQSAQTEEQALEIRERVQAESTATVARHGWTPEKFNSVGEAINNDPVLTDRAVKLIEEK